jgi:deoxyadenosine/deoxycytidine kinase
MSQATWYIVIEGVIGVGKSTLTRLLGRPLGAETLLEVVEENPFLQDFYGDRARYAFQTETFFLLSRYRQQQAVVRPSAGVRNLVSDYLFAKNRLFASQNLRGDEWDLFLQLYRTLADRVQTPDLVVYLQADVDTLMSRIAQRDRPFERNMDRDYIEGLREAYERFFADYTEAPVLAIETDSLNLLRDAEARARVLGTIRAALAGYQQQSLI